MNYNKYIALAHMSPLSAKLVSNIEDRWPDWLALVEDAAWLRSFSNSPLLLRKSRARTPKGALVEGWFRFRHHAVADALYFSAVWGFGFEKRHETSVYWKREIARIQGSAGPLSGSIDTINRLEPLPIPFRALDDWLDNNCL